MTHIGHHRRPSTTSTATTRTRIGLKTTSTSKKEAAAILKRSTTVLKNRPNKRSFKQQKSHLNPPRRSNRVRTSVRNKNVKPKELSKHQQRQRLRNGHRFPDLKPSPSLQVQLTQIGAAVYMELFGKK